MTFAIVSNWNGPGDFERLAELTIPNRRDYAAQHGYGEAVFNFPGHFGKISAILQSWDKADFIWWLDVDAIVTNPAVRLQDLAAADVVLSCDENGLNSGSMIFRTIPEVRAVLIEVLHRRKAYDVPPWHDQNGLAYQLWKIRERVRIVPKRSLNSYPNDWQIGDFVLHCPGIPNQDRLKILERHVKRMGG